MEIGKIKCFLVPTELSEVDFDKIVADSDSMETPPALLKAINEYFGDECSLNLDVSCIGSSNSKCTYYDTSGLSGEWKAPYGLPTRVWCNPPYSNPYPWVEKAYHEVSIGNARLVVLLLRFDPSTKLWRDFYPLCDEVYLLTDRRVRFVGRWLKADGSFSKNTTSNYPHMLMVFGRR